MDWPTIAIGISTLTFCGSLGGGLIAWGRLREQIVTEEECKTYRGVCQGAVCKKVEEVKTLVIALHEKDSIRIKSLDENMSDRIRSIDQRREAAKDVINEKLSELTAAISRVEGKLE